MKNSRSMRSFFEVYTHPLPPPKFVLFFLTDNANGWISTSDGRYVFSDYITGNPNSIKGSTSR